MGDKRAKCQPTHDKIKGEFVSSGSFLLEIARNTLVGPWMDDDTSRSIYIDGN